MERYNALKGGRVPAELSEGLMAEYSGHGKSDRG